MEFKYILGVDMSKQWFHFCLMNDQMELIWQGQVDNHPDKIFEFIAQLCDRLKIKQIDSLVLCMEHTGIYIQHLVRCWLGKGGRLSVIPAAKVTQYLAGQRGFEEKQDHIDAHRLAEYAFRFRDKLQEWQLKSHTLEQLQRFQRQRERLIKAINLLQVPIEESLNFDSAQLSDQLQANQAESIAALKKDLKNLEAMLDQVIEQDPYLQQLFELIDSVEGVGSVIAREIIISTEAFTKFSPDQAKSYARYAGVVPLAWESGTSVKKRKKTSNRANLKIKSLLTIGAISLISTKQELGLYYHRKRQQGKAHLAVINAMRNKMILRIFAVVKNQLMYQKNLNLCLDNP